MLKMEIRLNFKNCSYESDRKCIYEKSPANVGRINRYIICTNLKRFPFPGNSNISNCKM